MARSHKTDESPANTLDRLRSQLTGGRNFLLEELDESELAAMQQLIIAGEAEIVSSACRPYLSAKLDRKII